MADVKLNPCDDKEDLEELEQSILSLCEEDGGDDENRTIIEAKNTDQLEPFHISPAKLAGIQLPVWDRNEVDLKSLFHSTSADFCKISPIKGDSSSCNVTMQSPGTPFGVHSERNNNINKFSSTPHAGNLFFPKRLKLAKGDESSCHRVSETIMEENESFEDLLESVAILCDKPSDLDGKPLQNNPQSTSTSNKINVDPIVTPDYCSNTTIEPDTGVVNDKNFFKTIDQTGSPFTGRFTSLNYSQQDLDDTLTRVEGRVDVIDNNVSVDILGLDNFIILDKDDSTESVDDGADKTLIEDINRKSLVEVHRSPKGIEQSTETKDSTTTSSELLALEVETNSDVIKSESNASKITEETGNDQISTRESHSLKRKASELESSSLDLVDDIKSDDDTGKPKLKERKIGTSDISTELDQADLKTELASQSALSGDVKSQEKDTPTTVKTSENMHLISESSPQHAEKPRIKQEPNLEDNECEMIAPLVHDVRIISPPPVVDSKTAEDSDDSVVEVIVVDESIEVIDILDQSSVCEIQNKRETTSASTKDKTDNLYTQESENNLIKKIKSNWGIDSVHKADVNLTSCRYFKKFRSSGSCSEQTISGRLEGSSRIPPLFKGESESIKSAISTVQGRSPLDIATDIQRQKTGEEANCQKKLNLMDSWRNERCHNLGEIHRQQRMMLKQTQVTEFRRALIFANSGNAYTEFQIYQMKHNHLQEREMLRCKQEEEMHYLLCEIEEEKRRVEEDSKKMRNNLDDMISKLKATASEDSVHPDRVHTTIDLYKGPCRSNNLTRSLVKVCLPADIASYMIREDEVYDMYYNYT